METGYLLQCSGCGTRNRVPHEKAAAGLQGKCGKCGAPLIPAHSLPVQVTDATWDREVLGAQAPAVVEAWSPTCGVCTQYEVSVRQLAGRLYGKAHVFQVNVDQNPRTAQRYDIRGVPTLLFFREGKHTATLVGAQGERGIRERLGV